jgi:hypothetical protein
MKNTSIEKLTEEYTKLQEEIYKKEEEINAYFLPLVEGFLADNDYTSAKECLRGMTDCASKILLFKKIITKESLI